MTAPVPSPTVAAPERAPSRSPGHAPVRRRLRAVPEGYIPRPVRVRRRRLVLRAAGVTIGVVILGIAAAHAALVDGQLRLQALEVEVEEATDAYQRLRLQVAELEAPERIVAAAQERLGMVPPPGVTYLSPSGPMTATEPTDPAAVDDASTLVDEAAGVGPSWTSVKPLLGTGSGG